MIDWVVDRLPTEADADEVGYVTIKAHLSDEPNDPACDPVWAHYTVVVPGQPWWSPQAEEVASPAPAPAPTRVVTALTAHGQHLYAACSDGTFWGRDVHTSCFWAQLHAIPQPDATPEATDD